ncbi:MAG: hypothetical protein AMS21_08305 [Gemmatimonas sp. SG8_38_2]|nr:MAG: hypothetical protein AMS21_08305 [Gemmatimonas sp. SG8_38_2]
MRVRKLVRHPIAVGIAATAVMLGCESDPVGPQAEDIYIEVRVTGGFAAVDYTFAVVGRSSEVVAIACEQVCDFEPGDLLADPTPAQVLYFAELLTDAGIHTHAGTDFGDQCCDQFHYTVEYREGDRGSIVSGATGSLPGDLSRAIGELHQLLSGTLPVIIDWPSRPDNWPHDPLMLRDFALEGPILELEVEYGGGCESHDHDLVAWGGWMESFPVQVNVLLSHEDRDDPCDALIHRTLRFDLTRLREDYVASYRDGGPGPTTIVLRLSVPDGAEARRIDYTF